MPDHLALLRAATAAADDMAAHMERGTRGRDAANAYAAGLRQALTITQEAHDADASEDPQHPEDPERETDPTPAAQARPAEVTTEAIRREVLDAAHAEPLARTLLGVPAGHGAPHHDAGQIKAEDFVAQVDKGGLIRSGRAHHQDEDGDWMNEDDTLITLADWRADRPDALTVWPAPTR